MKALITTLTMTLATCSLFADESQVSTAGRDGSAESSPLKKIDWAAFMQQHDMTFDRLPRNWQEAPHFGNAMVGSMLYQAGDTIRLQVFRADVHDHRDDTFGWPAYSRARLQIGHFSLNESCAGASRRALAERLSPIILRPHRGACQQRPVCPGTGRIYIVRGITVR